MVGASFSTGCGSLELTCKQPKHQHDIKRVLVQSPCALQSACRCPNTLRQAHWWLYVSLVILMSNGWSSLVKVTSDECHWTHWWWLCTTRQQAITLADIEPDLCRHMASLGHNELTHEDIKLIWNYRHMLQRELEYIFISLLHFT